VSKGLELRQGQAGGFSVVSPRGPEILVETTIGMNPDQPSDLIASDRKGPGSKAELRVAPRSANGFTVEARWENFTLKRNLKLLPGGHLQWCETWRNVGQENLGLPFRHRVFLRDEAARFRLAGDPETENQTGVAANPTLFLESEKHKGQGLGITLENDWLRVLARMRHKGGVSEIFTADLALRPGATIDFEMTVTAADGDYWPFINSVRERWGVNRGTVERPTFWRIALGKGKTMEERIRNAVGNLGPINFLAWLSHSECFVRPHYEASPVREGRYAKLPRGAPRTAGKTPDLDVEKHLTFEHREQYFEEFGKYVRAAKRGAANARVLCGMHPSINVVYWQLLDRYPYAKDIIIGKNGKPFQDGHYNVAFLNRETVDKDWGVGYFVPREGSVFLKMLLADYVRAMDEYGADGFYTDEFSFNNDARIYSRYDYGRWDGYSAILDEKGRIAKLRSDNTLTSEYGQQRIIDEIEKRGKFLIVNGPAVTRNLNNRVHTVRFCEGGNGVCHWVKTHLSTVPLIYANYGEARRNMSRPNLLKDVRTVLAHGCLHSPSASNLVLDGPDNFITKCHPLTVKTIGPGAIIGKERVITMKSGVFAWPEASAKVRLYVYDRNGDVQNRGNLQVVTAGGGSALKLEVPEDGLVIAESVSE